jgi:hypothetical protein
MVRNIYLDQISQTRICPDLTAARAKGTLIFMKRAAFTP